jgi:hypothetical protein
VPYAAFHIVDCDQGATFSSFEGGPGTRITGADAINSALYLPWVQAPEQSGKISLRCPRFEDEGARLDGDVDSTKGDQK